MQRDAWSVMGTELTVKVYRRQSDSVMFADDLQAAYAEVAEIDRLMSLYRSDSELTLLNARSGDGYVTVSTPMMDVLRASEYYARLTDRALDVTVQPLIELWGFYHVARARSAVADRDRICAAARR